jgi:formylglycine-generating enzyme required for sulfatase activity
MDCSQKATNSVFKFALLIFLSVNFTLHGQKIKLFSQPIPDTEVNINMIPIPAGSFIMGSPGGSPGRDGDEGPQKQVLISAFWMSETEITFEQWVPYFKNMELPQQKDIDGVSRPTAQYIDLTWGMGRDPKHPTNSMSQQAAIAYCKWLYDKTGVFYRLPTEAEWEYACRAGNTAAYYFGNDPSQLKDYGYFKENSGETFHKTATLKPNAWGLYDMLGNLSEWTLDQYYENSYSNMKMNNPVQTPSNRYPRAVRGGSFMDEAKDLRCANRIASKPAWNQRDPQIPKSEWWLTDGMFVGFRIVKPYNQPTKEEITRFFEVYLK